MDKKTLYECIMKNVAIEVKKALNESAEPVQVGDRIRIIELTDDPAADRYRGKTGVVEYIDSMGQLHGTWGGLAVIPGIDEFEIM